MAASNDASSGVRVAADATDELASSIAEIARQITQTHSVVRQAVDEAHATDGEMTTLAESAQKIGDVVALIRNIAGPNQSPGAQRHDRGGARRRSGQGVRGGRLGGEIARRADGEGDRGYFGQIVAVQGSTGCAVEAIHRITERMQEIDRNASAVAASVEQQSSATSEISNNVASAAERRPAWRRLGELAGAAADTRKTAETVLEVSKTVERRVRSAPEVETFLAKVAA